MSTAGTSDIHLIAADELESTVREIFTAAGCSTDEAGLIARELLGANLAGHDSHGVVRVPLYVDWMRQGYVLAGQEAQVVTDGGAFVVLDGNRGFGQTIAAQAVALGVERAQASGSCIVALRNAGHIGRVGAYAETALAAGLISIHFVNVAGSPLVAPFGAVERRFSTAPFAVGLPLPERPVVLDFATSLVAEGKVQVASYGGRQLPADALIAPDGTTSSDPHVLYGDYGPTDLRQPGGGDGAIRAFGDHKGSGLALMCELLAGAFTGGGCAGPLDGPRKGITNGALSIYLSPAHFGTQAEFERIAREYLDWVLAARPADPAAPVLAPGEPEAAMRTARLAEGVPLPANTWGAIRRTAEALGVTL
ncbi:malate/lactate/ureidoglycolate dehydrogenase [Pseudonocardia sp. MH-G8]|uniref:malate/lactate/ureidoglycolate dehydrogenase n=1 Tax=Pseudonocardia sp. MH-G8 TaxID=1854588 RepID=UPI000BA11B4F|nr:malate/lactate/ureidoglycolate dehydrogenase [Pseudonocardia sp. MH-G8]OZM76996.1 malate/lactate/ureidoglycolate dehydrogenase [Pseudonocardia sp. MH-G8]